jgi:hypothetical protein
MYLFKCWCVMTITKSNSLWGFKSSGMWHHVIVWVIPSVLKDCDTFIFKGQAHSSWTTWHWPWRLYDPLNHRDTHLTTQRNFLEDLNSRQHSRMTLKSCNLFIVLHSQVHYCIPCLCQIRTTPYNCPLVCRKLFLCLWHLNFDISVFIYYLSR